MNSIFTKRLLDWNKRLNIRSMPWKGERNAYRIWLSEIILQQTRVEQGLAYYYNFINTFPTVHELANAPEQQVFKLWEGLGYYSRCKNLIATARFVSRELHGEFPDNYEQLRNLKGIGPYTAAAVASFAFDQPHAVVDGNVIRVIARYFGISTPLVQSASKNLYALLAGSLLDQKHPAQYNQAIMDFGAVICKPQQPLCEHCVQNKECEAFNNHWTAILPFKEKKAARKERWFYYFLLESEGHVFVRKRGAKDIWENLFEFILREKTEPATDLDQLISLLISDFGAEMAEEGLDISPVYRQLLTHQIIHGQVIHIKLTGSLPGIKGYEKVPLSMFPQYPFPKFINAWLNTKLFEFSR